MGERVCAPLPLALAFALYYGLLQSSTSLKNQVAFCEDTSTERRRASAAISNSGSDNGTCVRGLYSLPDTSDTLLTTHQPPSA